MMVKSKSFLVMDFGNKLGKTLNHPDILMIFPALSSILSLILTTNVIIISCQKSRKKIYSEKGEIA